MRTINLSLSGAAITALLAGAIPVAPASAQDSIPDLTGSWSGAPTGGAVFGNVARDEPVAEPRFGRTTLTFTLTIEAQEGPGLIGTYKKPNGSERIIGVIRSDNKTIYFVDEDTYFIGTLLSEDEIELCDLETGGDSMVAACLMFERQ